MLRASFLLLFIASVASAQDDPGREFLNFIKGQAQKLRANDAPPKSLDEWQKRRAGLQQSLNTSLGIPTSDAALDPQFFGELKRDGYTVQKLTFQTLPGLRMTANAYVPAGAGRRPAVLCVHGHWKGAKQDPAVQARCIGLVKLGFFVLCVDALGAGERAIGTALGEYHGEMVGASLLTLGRSLCGLQVFENRRAVDYLLTRPEVDPARIGITGASGGGNQTMYAAALDDRLKCAVPVCSVGNYQAYLGAACCMCEVVPGVLRFTEESGLLSLIAPRGLMVISATKDAFQFSVGEAKKSIAAAEPVFQLYQKPANIRHTIFESGHDYSRPMREAMYGWMTLHLKGQGTGEPIPEPKHTTEQPEELRCYPGDSRPADWLTIPKLLAREGRKLTPPNRSDAETKKVLVEQVFGGFPSAGPAQAFPVLNGRHRFEPEPGVSAYWSGGDNALSQELIAVVTLDGREALQKSERWKSLQKLGKKLVVIEPRGTGLTAWKSDKVGRAPDHNTAEWSLWIGRPLLGQWTLDVLRALKDIRRHHGDAVQKITLIGEGPAALVALCAGSLDDRVSSIVTVGLLNSYLGTEPIVGQRLGLLAPKIIPLVGDVPRIARLGAPKRLFLVDTVNAKGDVLPLPQMLNEFGAIESAWEQAGAKQNFKIVTNQLPNSLAELLK